jgi:hypothetical protein
MSVYRSRILLARRKPATEQLIVHSAVKIESNGLRSDNPDGSQGGAFICRCGGGGVVSTVRCFSQTAHARTPRAEMRQRKTAPISAVFSQASRLSVERARRTREFCTKAFTLAPDLYSILSSFYPDTQSSDTARNDNGRSDNESPIDC